MLRVARNQRFCPSVDRKIQNHLSCGSGDKGIATTSETSNVTSLPTAPKLQTSKEVIAANVKLLIEQLEAGHSEGLTACLTAMGKFHTYSLRNILEIARQMPSASRVAGMYRAVEDEVKGTTFKHRIAKVHATSMKRLSKIEAADDPSDGAGEE
jgi:hypothetical protein